MTKEREALKMALEALHGFIPYLPLNDGVQCGRYDKAITAIKEALGKNEFNPDWNEKLALTEEVIRLSKRIEELEAQPSVSVEQEPVTWRYKIVDVFGRPAWTLKTPKSDTRVLESQPLYTTSPQRKPLTDEEMQAVCTKTWSYDPYVIARAIEAAHGIKGEA